MDRQLHERPDGGGGLLAGGVGLRERRVKRDDRDEDADQRQDGLPEGEADEGALGAGGNIGRGRRFPVVVAAGGVVFVRYQGRTWLSGSDLVKIMI